MTIPLTPTWLTPSTPGMLSNRRGSNVGADAIPFSARYRHQLGATVDPPSALQVQARRTVAQGTPQAGDIVWDSGLQGTFPFNPPAGLPAPVNSGPGGVPSYATCVASLSSDPSGPARVYATFGTYRIYSALIAGAGIGPWRLSIDLQGLPGFTLPPIQIFQTGDPAAPTAFMHVFSTDGATLVHKRLAIAADGALSVVLDTAGGDWVNLNTVATIQQVIPGFTGAFALLVGGVWGLQAATAVVHNLGLDENGVIISITTLAPLPTALRAVAGFYDVNSRNDYVIGGDSGGSPSAAIYSIPAFGGAWTTLPTGIPQGRARHAVVAAGGYVYVVGGQFMGTAQATVYSHLISTLGTAWSTGTALPNATQDQGTVIQTSGAAVVIGVYGGTYSQSVAMGSRLSAGANGAWITGPAAAMTAATVGSGGTFVVNPDGSADIGFVYGGFGDAATAALLDGDQIEVSITLFARLKGDASPVAITTVKIGQPPTITGQSTAITVAKPTLIFFYAGGAGGSGELSYRVVVLKHSDSSLAFDSGVVKGSANSVLANIAPYLLNATLYDISYTVWSADTPIDGNSSNTGIAAGTVTPAYGTAPLQPTALAAVADAVNGWFRLTWTDPGGTRTAWRIYYKRNGSATWLLYQDSVALASNAGINLMDELAPGASYDFTVSGINGTTGEGAMSAAMLNVTLSPTTWTAMLHVAGAGPTAGNAVALTMPAPPTFIDNTERTHMIGFGQRAGAVRWGPADWHSIDLKISLPGGAAALRALIALLTQAQAGTPLVYRDVYGHMFVVSPTPGWQADLLGWDQQAPNVYRYVTLSLDEIANLYAASVASGSALGMRGQSAGSVIPLDLAETAA